MNKTSILFIYIMMIATFGIGHAQSTNVNEVSKKLTLELQIDNDALKKASGTIPLIVTLTNHSDKAVRFQRSDKKRPLLVFVYSQHGKSLTSKHLGPIRKGRDNSQAVEIVIEAKESIVYKRQLNLATYKDDIAKDSYIELLARFALFRIHEDHFSTALVKSNRIKYQLAEKRK